MSDIEEQRKYYECMMDEIGAEYRRRIDDLVAENEKLRKLMRDTYDCICDMYLYMDGGAAYDDAESDPSYGPILKRMRELGVGV